MTDKLEIPHVQGPVFDHADKYGIARLKLNPIGRRHYPDSVFFFPGEHLLMMEFKRVGEGLKRGQELKISELLRLGFAVFVVDEASDGIRILERHRKKYGARASA